MLPTCIIAQNDIKKKGDIYFDAGNYTESLKAYKLYNKIEKDPKLLIKRGICYLKTNQPDACINDMASAHQLKSLDNTRFKYSAEAYFSKREYSLAAGFYKKYLNTLKPESKEWKFIISEIKRCGFSRNYKFLPQLAFVENLGTEVNTEYDEFGPVQSPTMPGRYYFSSAREGTTGGLRDISGLSDDIKGHYSADMFMVDLKDGNWSSVSTFEELLNSPKHDILQDFNQDGTIIYYIKSADLKSGTLYTDTFDIDRDPNKLPKIANIPFKAEQGDKDLFVYNDSLIIFASNMEGGFGSYDLYFSIKKNSFWQPPVNMGPKINSEANEISPYLVKNGESLYFSSDRNETFGGFDIFVTTHILNGSWSEVNNLGPPINSPGNDFDLELSFDGMSAIFASDRIESLGKSDLYIAYLKDQILGQLEYTEMPWFVKNLSQTDSTFIEMAENEVSPVNVQNGLKDFINKPLYFTKNEDVLNLTNMNQIRKIADLMIIYPEIKVLLSSHFITEGRVEFDLYFSIKRAEKVAEQFIKYGISPHRIFLQGCGSGFPFATPYINGIQSSLADKINRRIDVEFLDTPPSKLKILNDLPAVATQYRDTLWDKFNDLNKMVTFRVKFSKVSQMLKSEALSWRNDVIVEKNASEDQYTYTMGTFLKYSEAKKLKEELKSSDYLEAKVLPYYHGILMDKPKVLQMIAENPELELYFNSEDNK